jgi:PhnB protein
MAEHITFPTLTPYLVVRDARAAIAFYVQALGAITIEVMETPEGKVMNAQLKIGDSMLMLNDEFPDYGVFGPKEGESIPVTIHISCTDIDNQFQRAIDAGGTVTMPLADQFWGDRYGQFRCPFGHNWSMGQPIG